MTTARSYYTATCLPNGQVLVAGGQTGSVSLASAELYEPDTETWTATGAMSAARRFHTSTLLPNGKVLVAGGFGTSGYLSSAELYDPETGIWSTTGSLPGTRYHHTATLLPNGKVLVAGGYGGGGYLSSAVLYDPATGLWTVTGSLTASRRLHTATLLASGKVLVAGGWGSAGYLSSAEVYDSATGTWAATGGMTTSRYWHTATRLLNGQVLAVGGYGTGGYRASAELYDPVAGTWTATGSIGTPCYGHTAALLLDGKVLVGGGYNNTNGYLSCAALYDPATGTWTNCAPMGTARAYHAAACLSNGRVLMAAGNGGGGAISGAEVFQASLPADIWTPTDGLSTARSHHTATTLRNGKVLVAGGVGSGGSLDSAELYDPVEMTWEPTGSLTYRRYLHTATLLPNGKVFVLGGTQFGGDQLANAELYDPDTEQWTVLYSMMGVPRVKHTATLLSDGRVLIAGGQDPDLINSLYSAELYDPINGTWTATASMNYQRNFHTATRLLDGTVLVAGGAGNGSPGPVTEVYDPNDETWTITFEPMHTDRFYEHVGTVLQNGLVLAAGGYGYGPFEIKGSAELYNPADGRWVFTDSMNNGRCAYGTLLPNGTVLAAGGYNGAAMSSAELYNPVTGLWADTMALSSARQGHTMSLMPNGSVLIVGGQNSGGYLGDAAFYQTYNAYSLAFLFPIAGQDQTLGALSGNISAGSGITFRPAQNGSEQDAILVLDNNPRRIIQFSRNGALQNGAPQRIITLQDFSDPEDIHWLGDPAHPDWYVISQEENGTASDAIIDEIVIISIPYAASGDITVDIDNAIRRLQISHDLQAGGFVSRQNLGLESVVLLGGNFYFTSEKDPSLVAPSLWNVWRVTNDVPNGVTGTSTVVPTKMFALPDLLGSRATDISGMTTDGTHLWLLSHEGTMAPRGRVLKMTTDGELVGDYLLPNFTQPSAGTWQQAEGIEMFLDPADGKMKIMVTGEIGGGSGVDFMLLSEP